MHISYMEIVTNELRSTLSANELPNTIILESKTEKGGFVRLYEFQGRQKNCAGLKMNRHALEPWSLPASSKRTYARVRINFPNTKSKTSLPCSYFVDVNTL